jgi:uncharacterized damage-inducible protein DinB
MQEERQPEPQLEPWLRGPIPGIHPLVMPVFFSYAQVREDLRRHTAGISDAQVWQSVAGQSLGFHLKHLAGSVDRITSYLLGRQLDAAQLSFLKQESQPPGTLAELLQLVEQSLTRSENELREIDAASLYAACTVGRRALPTTMIGLIVHLAEHTQRHLGQAILLAKILRQPG